MIMDDKSTETTRQKLAEHYRHGGLPEVVKWGFGSIYQRTVGRIRDARAPKLEDVLAQGDIADRFAYIYRTNYWGSPESRSGLGSDLRVAEVFIGELEAYLEKGRVNSLFDAPCGDYNWMKSVRTPVGMKYLGGDLVPELIKSLNDRYGSATTSFTVFNIVQDEFPRADVWLCRECLFHLSFADVRGALENFVRSEIEWALITCNYDVEANIDIESGAWRPLDLRMDPIGLPEPKQVLKEGYTHEHKRFVGLWSRDAIRSSLERA